LKTPADLIRDWIHEDPKSRNVLLLAEITGISKTMLYSALRGEHFSSMLAMKLGKAIDPRLVAEAIRDTDDSFADILDRYKKNENSKG